MCGLPYIPRLSTEHRDISKRNTNETDPKTRRAYSSTNLLCVRHANIFTSLSQRVKALHLHSFRTIIMIMMMILIIVSLIVIIILCFIVITVTGDVGSRPCYKGAWSIRLLCSAYTLVGSGNYDDEDDDMMMMVMMMVMMIMMVMMVMMNKIRMVMIIMTMMMMTQTDVFQESSNSPSSLSFRSRTLYKFQPDLSAGDFFSSCLYLLKKN